MEGALNTEWFKRRRYKHFDVPVSKEFAKKVQTPAFVAKHSFSPLIHYLKTEKRYKKCLSSGRRVLTTKPRPIKYASHRDACIYSWYAHQLTERLNAFYEAKGISDSVIAYRRMGRSNYNFSAEALEFAHSMSPVSVLAFDVSSFFDTLDHRLLKERLKAVMESEELPVDWYKVFRRITNFHYVELGEIKSNSTFAERLASRDVRAIARIDELKAAGINIRPNPEIAAGRRRGIPQGTPISAVLSNLYMVELDVAARAFCDSVGAFYRRYSDDILVICKPEDASSVEARIMELVSNERLEIQPHKTERTLFDANAELSQLGRAAQYLGFNFDETGAVIRASSLARQWRKMRRDMRKAKRFARAKRASGSASPVFTKRLRRRYCYTKVNDGGVTRTVRNFSSYARRSADAFGNREKIRRQIRRLEQAALDELEALKRI